MRLALTSNEPRSRYLFEELRRQAEVVAEVNFENIDVGTKALAALLSFKPRRRQWYQSYQMHPLVQRRRRRVLRRELAAKPDAADALLMWGSWFDPRDSNGPPSSPFFNYIDQSLAITPVLGEPPAPRFGREKAHRLQAATYAASSGILCMSEWARAQTLLAHTIDPSKVSVIGWGPCGIDLSAEDIPWSSREKLVIHVSNDYRRKGVDFLLRVAENVEAVDPAVRFVVIGRDASGMVVSDTSNVQFVGQVSDRGRLTDYFRRACAFFLPYRFDRSPHVLVESMSAGLPFVSSAQGGAVELAAAGAGFAVPIGDVPAYTTALLSLTGDFERAAKLGQKGRQLVQSHYSWPAVATKAIALMARAIERGKV